MFTRVFPLRDSQGQRVSMNQAEATAFGETIDDAVARGKAGEETFFASENGRTVGTRAVDRYNVWVANDSVHDRYYCKGCDGSCVGTPSRCSQRP